MYFAPDYSLSERKGVKMKSNQSYSREVTHNDENWGMKIFLIIIAFAIVSFIVPIALEYFVFRNNIYSALSNGEWGSFLGSFLGGIIGGVGTLTAVFITTKETRKIQRETANSLEVDRKARRMGEKKEFVNQIVKLIGEYIADISAYFYANRLLERLENDKSKLIQKINCVDTNLMEAHSDMESNAENATFILSNSCTIEKLNVKKARLIMDKEDKDREIENTRKDRLIANKCLFTIKIMLKDINCASELITQLDTVHNLAASAYSQSIKSIETATNKLIDLAAKFNCDYINE